MVKWSKTATDDLRAIYDYISKDSMVYAKRVIEELVSKSEYLVEYPNLGRIVPELNNSKVRELMIFSYRMVYQVENDDVEILTLIHSRKNFDFEIK